MPAHRLVAAIREPGADTDDGEDLGDYDDEDQPSHRREIAAGGAGDEGKRVGQQGAVDADDQHLGGRFERVGRGRREAGQRCQGQPDCQREDAERHGPPEQDGALGGRDGEREVGRAYRPVMVWSVNSRPKHQATRKPTPRNAARRGSGRAGRGRRSIPPIEHRVDLDRQGCVWRAAGRGGDKPGGERGYPDPDESPR